MNNFLNIGFSANSQFGLFQLVDQVYRECSIADGNTTSYHIYSDPSGAQIYIEMDDEKKVLRVCPYFEGESRRLVVIIKTVGCFHPDIKTGVYSWALANEDDDNGLYPMIIEMPDIETFQGLGGMIEMQLCAFAQHPLWIGTEKVFYENQTTTMKKNHTSFFPLGLSENSGDYDTRAVQAICEISGRIRAFEKRLNEFSQSHFYWFLIETYGGEIDVVADLSSVSIIPNVGDILTGEFWIMGKILDL